jgi:hypothetical protein
LVPGCSRSAESSRSCGSIGRLRIENVVPTETFTSMFEEPSSGSKMTMYLASAFCFRTIGSSFSSEARMPMLSRSPR